LKNDKYGIVSIGSATRDVFIASDQIQSIASDKFKTGAGLCFGLGSKAEIKKIVFTAGGGGTNAAVTFARQGLKTAFVGVVGRDLNGKEIEAELKREGIDPHLQEHDDDFTAYSVILVHPNGERSILSYKGEGYHFDVNKIDFDALETDWLFLDSLGGHFEILKKSIEWAASKGIKIATNPGSKELEHGLAKLAPLLKKLNIVITNQEEAAGLTGLDYKDEGAIFKKMDELIDGIFVMTKGHDGVAVSDGKTIYHAGVPDSPIVERAGAGDAFSSGFIVEYAHSGDIVKAIQFATANASSVVTQYGAKAGILKKDDWGPWPLVNVEISTLTR